jgi:hypothetical protein
MALVQDELQIPAGAEVSALLHYARSAPQDAAGHPVNTGARINALALTR